MFVWNDFFIPVPETLGKFNTSVYPQLELIPIPLYQFSSPCLMMCASRSNFDTGADDLLAVVIALTPIEIIDGGIAF